MCDAATQVSGAVMQTGGVAIWIVGYVSSIIGAFGSSRQVAGSTRISHDYAPSVASAARVS